MSEPQFTGSTEQQELAEEIFFLMRMQGQFFAADAPIKQTLRHLVDYLAEQRRVDPHTMETEIESALQANAQVFAREEINDEVFYVTSRIGSYQPTMPDTRHSFQERFYEPEKPLPIDDISVVISTSRPALTTVEPVFISDYWQEQAEFATPPSRHAGYADDEQDGDGPVILIDREQEGAEEPRPTTPPGAGEPYHTDEAPTVAGDVRGPGPVDVSGDTLADMAGTPGMPVSPAPASPDSIDTGAAGAAGTAGIEDRATPAVDTGAPDADSTPAGEPDTMTAPPHEGMADDETQAGDVAEPPEETASIEPPAPARPAEETTFHLPDGTPINLALPRDNVVAASKQALETFLAESIDQDPLRRLARFGRNVYPEAGVVSLGKNDLRRIRDYILEVGEPLTDTMIIDNLYYHNPRNSDYEGFRFSLNYRLSREKDFEFVGIEGARLWSTKGLAPIGTKRVKAGEMGQLTAYLTESYDNSTDSQSVAAIQETGTVERFLSFFEWQYGVLPLDRSLATLLPEPLLEEQRRTVFRFESPQHYTSFLVEVRYPTGNRGGWLQGFDEFFHEHLISGAFITLARTEEPNVFTIAYEEAQHASERLLTLDEKKNKFTFADVTYECLVDEEQSVTQQRFGKAKNLKSLPMSERRKADVVLQHIFETMGERGGSRDEPHYRMHLDDLLVVYNVLRPTSLSYLHALLEEDEGFLADESAENTYIYQPEPEETEEEPEVELPESDEESQTQGRRWSFEFGSDDDEEDE